MEISKGNNEFVKRTRRQNQLRWLGLAIAGFMLCCGLIFAKVNSPGKATADEGKWDLSQVYLSLDAWRADLPELDKSVARAGQFKRRLGLSPEVLGEFMKARDAVATKAARLYTYVNLLFYRDMRNSENQAVRQELQNRIAKVDNDLAWIDAELVGIGREKLLSWSKTVPGLRPYQHHFIDLLRQQEHILPEEQQKLVGILSRPLAAAKNTYSSLAVADYQPEKVKLEDGREISATLAEMEKFLSIPSSQGDRKKVATAALAPFIRHKTTYAEIFKGIIEARWALAQVYGFASCLEQTLHANDIPKEVYLKLIGGARNGVAPLHKYMSLRKKVLGLNEFLKADQYVSLVDFNQTYLYQEAASLVAQALAPLGKDYGDQVRRAFSEGWIDVFPVAGKWGGAFAMDVNGVHPYVLLNFSGTRNNLFTLVHELGHAMHSVLADASQPFISHEYSSFAAEVAAIFNEHLLLDFLVENSRDPRERIDLLDQAIQNLIRKFYGSARRSEFEYQAYSLIEQGKPVNAEILAELYNGLEKQYLGDTVMLADSDPERYGWPVISHFFTHYYYVFQYATSYAASVNLFQQLKQSPDRAAKERIREKYLALLRSGGNGYPIDQLRAAGADLTGEAPFQAVVNEMSRLVDRLERELKFVGKIQH